MNTRNIAIILSIISIALFLNSLPSIEKLTFSAIKDIPQKDIIQDTLQGTKKISTPTADVVAKEPIPEKVSKTEIPQTIKEIKQNIDTPDFSAIKDVKQKKATFFTFMLSKIIVANKKVTRERDLLIALMQNHSNNQQFSDSESATFTRLAKKYRVNKTKQPIVKKLQQLKLKIDQVPPSLILAQSANESAWGTSRFARKGNNFFGQWCYSKGCGLVPAARDSGSTHEVAKFGSVQKSVEEYIYNINVGRSYRKIRTLRAEMLANKQAIDSLVLATGLEKYSERGKEYVKEIQSMIRFNKLKEYD